MESKIDFKKYREAEDQGYINIQKHPTADLYILNYSHKCQYDRFWTEETLTARGLIVDGEGVIKARPFRKFFNLEEYEGELPNETFMVFDKLDGSLGISYWIDNQMYIATRGSFTSEQAIKANEILKSKFALGTEMLDPAITYLFEIIFPANRIVVDYGQMQDLILLATIETETGEELVLNDIHPFSQVKWYHGIHDVMDIKKLQEKGAENAEGFVVRFQSGLRLKLKYAEYVRLHRIITGISNKAIWELLKDNEPLDQLLERVPDEFYAWVKQTVQELTNNFNKIADYCIREFKTIDRNALRKDQAERIKKSKYPAVLFKMLDNNPYDNVIWKMCKPVYSKAFKVDIDQ